MALPNRENPVFPTASPSHQEASISLLSSSIRGQTKGKPQSQKTDQQITWIIALSNSVKLWAILCRASQDGWITVKTSHKMWSTSKGMASHLSILTLTTPWTVWKGKKLWHRKTNSPGWEVHNMLLEKSGKIAPEGRKRLSQRGNNTQLWMWLVMEVQSDAVKNNITQEPGMLGSWIKVNCK